MIELYPYQERLVPHLGDVLKSDKRIVILNGGTGLGKTYVTLETLRRSNLSFGVVAPKITLNQWRNSADVVGVKPLFVANIEKLRTGKQTHIVTKESTFNWNWTCDADVIVLDEFHRFGGMTSQSALMAANISRSKSKVFAITATLADSQLKVRAMLHLARMCPWKDYLSWCRSHAAFRDEKINGNPWRIIPGEASRKVMAELGSALFPAYGVQVKLEDIPDFPEVLNVAELVTPSDSARVAINIAYQTMREEVRNPDKAKTDLTRLLRSRQRVEVEKTAIFKELIEDALEEGYSVVASFNFTEPLFEMKRQMAAHNPAMIYGSDPNGKLQTEKERDAEKARFQSNSTRLMLLSIQAGSVGVSLGDEHGGHPRIAFHNLPLDSVSFTQLLGRIHRANSKTKSVNKVILTDGVAVEKRIYKLLNNKLKNMGALQDDSFDLDSILKEES